MLTWLKKPNNNLSIDEFQFLNLLPRPHASVLSLQIHRVWNSSRSLSVFSVSAAVGSLHGCTHSCSATPRHHNSAADAMETDVNRPQQRVSLSISLTVTHFLWVKKKKRFPVWETLWPRPWTSFFLMQFAH